MRKVICLLDSLSLVICWELFCVEFISADVFESGTTIKLQNFSFCSFSFLELCWIRKKNKER